ncbi:hypothetical protein AURDEDRAFT_167768 [Auricularia subglabra TFB-10046 SS5]|nr:hypothetical protein AURDEDRAFT_167768 [Auricularia subglabra TFB-10046 SS5]
MHTDKRAAACTSLCSPPSLLMPRSPTLTCSTNASRSSTAPKAVTTPKETCFAMPSVPMNPLASAQPPIVNKTAGELFTLVPAPLKLQLNNARSSSGRLQRLVSDVLTGSSDKAVTGPEVRVRDGIAKANLLPVLKPRMQGGRVSRQSTPHSSGSVLGRGRDDESPTAPLPIIPHAAPLYPRASMTQSPNVSSLVERFMFCPLANEAALPSPSAGGAGRPSTGGVPELHVG